MKKRTQRDSFIRRLIVGLAVRAFWDFIKDYWSS